MNNLRTFLLTLYPLLFEIMHTKLGYTKFTDMFNYKLITTMCLLKIKINDNDLFLPEFFNKEIYFIRILFSLLFLKKYSSDYSIKLLETNNIRPFFKSIKHILFK